ncbi:Protein kinase domain containing protein, putative [Trypanosoma equiperdum]|uniref:Protein kinase domain containing protein, putative n=1 Tax=Trypanosoma equiperdum TaxID=5694 RepID=A0A1G4IIL1_TRYEQ|nr:Protein kinase domain containing protein, putative [Trypanosoma equiperdum]
MRGNLITGMDKITGDGCNDPSNEANKKEPTLAIDRWMHQSGAQNIVNNLLVDIVINRPKNVMEFIHTWSAPPMAQFGLSRTCSAVLPFDTMARGRDEYKRGEAVTNEGGDEAPLGGSSGPRTDDDSKFDLQREIEPTPSQLLQMFPEEESSPYEFLKSDQELESCFSLRQLSSTCGSSFTGYIGRGNYGIVVPAKRKSVVEVDGVCADSTATSRNQGSDCVLWNGTPTGASIKARRVAIKISRVQGKWTLDESCALQTVTSAAHRLETDVRTVERELEQLKRQAAGVSEECTEGDESELSHIKNNITELEGRLHVLRTFLTGSLFVVKLVGSVMYSIKRDALLFPLELYPTSLGDCINKRSEIYKVSSATGCPFPSHDGTGGTGATPRTLFTVREVQHVAWSICHALYFLNNVCNLCHLDVKAENILLSKPWPFGDAGAESLLSSPLTLKQVLVEDFSFPRVVLTDLGLAQRLGSPISQLGDFSTMAPEVYWASASAEPRYEANRVATFAASCDMWSVGCVLLRMLNGLEYAVWDPAATFMAMEENFLSPALRHPEAWPSVLNDFVMRCFERDPRQRMTAASALCHPFFNLDVSS